MEDCEKSLPADCKPMASQDRSISDPMPLTPMSGHTLVNSTTEGSVLNDRAQRRSFWRRLLRRQTKLADVESGSRSPAAATDNNGDSTSDEGDTASDESEVSLPEMRVRSLQKFPRGYPYLAAFADSDENFMLYRRFGYLQSQILLQKQDELRVLEDRLDSLDRSEMHNNPTRLWCRERQGDERKALLTDIEQKFCEYSRLVHAAQRLMKANKPTANEHTSVLKFMASTPVADEEADYVLHKEDLINLRPGREHAWLDRAIEGCLKSAPRSKLANIFRSETSLRKSDDENHIYFDKNRINLCASSIITLMILFMLIVPIYFLYHLVERSNGAMTGNENAICIGVLLIFTLVFSAVMSFFTRARRHEILGAAAAYCAVLVVFLGNVGNGSAS
ncbi:hypothetical protein CLAFUW4_09630 [Fulvia fulva]|uniref:DUF6594 domain-containing protein n=1 Tax=Passalora fulva TaxID=5499 RepID=A0A9Q8UT90_PASFU|nr:uncharacterized protein CLAFUR5_09724 [Fulvia fulva]KAK4613567.1 hypothetical protein CLAFUR4_09635 [Fulvia fulva]KAK4614408.1 hypothetical protein CLAFUR0_09626 [Fulvia fulva]UJO21535.1 hypothetical protein CLAFUR5_09724 [Fulvia fulva]WPV20115.1 hypothetical protein CLAFUW4_09630 [Fulvia fulva]WPV35587.1 hypothetical protein CLAFUW7_09631 [Fulvia fulva]